MQRNFLGFVFVGMLVVLSILAVQRGTTYRLWGNRNSIVRMSSSRIPLDHYGKVLDFSLTAHSGESLELDDLRGTIWLADFIFTYCASSCPIMTSAFQDLRRKLPAESKVKFISFSVDPERDTPKRLQEYMREHGILGDQWTFLTGDKQTIFDLIYDGFRLSIKDASAADRAAGTEPILHSTRFVLVDGEGEIRGYYDALDSESCKTLLKEIKQLEKDGNS